MKYLALTLTHSLTAQLLASGELSQSTCLVAKQKIDSLPPHHLSLLWLDSGGGWTPEHGSAKLPERGRRPRTLLISSLSIMSEKKEISEPYTVVCLVHSVFFTAFCPWDLINRFIHARLTGTILRRFATSCNQIFCVVIFFWILWPSPLPHAVCGQAM